ncbi:MAG TPA: polysaccharide biosynthesis/export family protein [Acetobacteraceae bacterium]|nr:polysaccharide biosynthesis/export family protein [Acetobacteraceae bacterium]
MRQGLRTSTALRGVVALSAAIGMAACTNTSNLPPAPLEPVALGPSAPLPPYRIQVGDVLDVRLILNPELNEEVTVRPDGHISTTVVRDARAAGLTVPELDRELVSDYSGTLQNPRVSVVVRSFAPTRIYVGGQVNNPGEFITVGPTLTLSQAIARAGGTKLSSDDTDVFIIRRGPDDKPEFLSVRYNDIQHGMDPSADVRLAPYDVVYVPKSGIAEVYKWYNQYIQQFANPSFGFSYIVNNPTTSVITTPTGATAP